MGGGEGGSADPRLCVVLDKRPVPYSVLPGAANLRSTASKGWLDKEFFHCCSFCFVGTITSRDVLTEVFNEVFTWRWLYASFTHITYFLLDGGFTYILHTFYIQPPPLLRTAIIRFPIMRDKNYAANYWPFSIFYSTNVTFFKNAKLKRKLGRKIRHHFLPWSPERDEKICF